VRCGCVSFVELLRAFRNENVACTFKNRVLIALLYDESPKYFRNAWNLSRKDTASYPQVISLSFAVPTS